MNSAHQDASDGIHMHPGSNISILDSAHLTRHVLRSEPVRKTQIKPVRSRIPVERSNRPGCVEKPCVINKYSMCV